MESNSVKTKYSKPSPSLVVCFWRNSPPVGQGPSFTWFLDHTQQRTTIGRTPLDAWSACRRVALIYIYIYCYRFSAKIRKVIHQTCAGASISGGSQHIHIIQDKKFSSNLQAYCLLGVRLGLQQAALLGTATYNRKPFTSNCAARNNLLRF